MAFVLLMIPLIIQVAEAKSWALLVAAVLCRIVMTLSIIVALILIMLGGSALLDGLGIVDAGFQYRGPWWGLFAVVAIYLLGLGLVVFAFVASTRASVILGFARDDLRNR